MHPDAIENYRNYRTRLDEPMYSDDMSDKDVVLILWSDQAYQAMTDDRGLENIPRRRREVLRDVWAASNLPEEKQAAAYARLRATFEAEGWMRETT